MIWALLLSSALAATTVNDITGLNPISVARVIRPTTNAEIREAVRAHPGPISIGGGRYSMGGQTGTEGALQIDMRAFDKVLALDVEGKTITVQAGIRWRDIQDEIDKHDLSVRIMQTYSNFTVGGSLSVNVHGRYVGEGPLVRSIVSIKIVLPDGREIVASPSENSDVFFGAIGGYGGLGVITEATLRLVPNEKLQREVEVIPVAKYAEYFRTKIRGATDIVLHNGDIYPPDYGSVRLETWRRTDRPLTIEARLIPRDQKYWLEPTAVSSISMLPFGSELRAKVLDPLLNKKALVVWRNYEASYDVAQLEPTTPRLLWTYVLQEYFVPVARFDEFVPKMRAILQKHGVNMINVSIRHAQPDPGTLLKWAPEEVFSFVLYYKQGTSAAATARVGEWTRELIDAALSVGGRHYLPYQLHATQAQFDRGYPGAKSFLALKKRLDPTNKCRNKLWDKYGH